MINMIEIKKRIEQLATQIHVPSNLMPTYGSSRNDGTPHIELRDSTYYYIVLERDAKITYRKTSDLDMLLYWVFEDITSGMASYYVRTHPNPEINSRRVRFEHQLSLLDVLKHEWKERRVKEIAEILKASPYRDVS